MSDEFENWDTHSINPYYSEYLKPFKGRTPGWEYCLEDVCIETFALKLWKFQEDYGLDYETAFMLSCYWRVLSPKRLTLMFGKDGYEMDESLYELKESHPETDVVENVLPKRNLPRMHPFPDADWMEGSPFD